MDRRLLPPSGRWGRNVLSFRLEAALYATCSMFPVIYSDDELESQMPSSEHILTSGMLTSKRDGRQTATTYKKIARRRDRWSKKGQSRRNTRLWQYYYSRVAFAQVMDQTQRTQSLEFQTHITGIKYDCKVILPTNKWLNTKISLKQFFY